MTWVIRPTTTLSIKNRSFELWISDDANERERGLMNVTAEQMAPLSDGTERGMLFAFDHELWLSFWMKDTFIPLDIAYLTTEGVVISTYTMAPTRHASGRPTARGDPARYAIEVNGGVWDEIGLVPGDRIDIPSSLLKREP